MIGDNPETLYLDLLKKALTYSLWPEPPLPVMVKNFHRPAVIRVPVSAFSSILARKNLIIAKNVNYDESDRELGRIWPQHADTMIGIKRLDNLQYCVETVLAEEVEGDLIETGAWRGGACIFMRAILAVHKVADRKVFVADSFKGLPLPDAESFPEDKGDRHNKIDYLAVSREDVENNFRKYELLDDQVVFLEGWFEDTLPGAPIERLSVLRLDGDMYGSTMESLNNLYPKLSSGGFCIIDDFNLEGCHAAVLDYREREGIEEEFLSIDGRAVYWRKT